MASSVRTSYDDAITGAAAEPHASQRLEKFDSEMRAMRERFEIQRGGIMLNHEKQLRDFEKTTANCSSSPFVSELMRSQYVTQMNALLTHLEARDRIESQMQQSCNALEAALTRIIDLIAPCLQSRLRQCESEPSNHGV